MYLYFSEIPICYLFMIDYLSISIFGDKVSLNGPAWPQSYNPPALVSQVLGLQVCTAMPSLQQYFYFY